MATPTVSAASHVAITGDPLIEKITAAVRTHMSRYDGSHDFSHIRRVVGLARQLTEEYEKGEGAGRALDGRLIALCALLHDVGDRKYLDLVPKAETAADETETDPGSAAVAAVLRRCGAPLELVRLVPLLCRHVSWSYETKTPTSQAETAALVAAHPELAIVQDADRIESIGAVGIARVFAYGGAAKGPDGRPGSRTLAASVAHFDEKLLRVETRMKTAAGRRLARERTARLETFRAWFQEEVATAVEDSA